MPPSPAHELSTPSKKDSSEIPCVDIAVLAKPQAIGQILQSSFHLYLKHFTEFTRPVILPVAYKLVGSLLALLLPFYVMDIGREWLLEQPLVARILLFLALPLPGTLLFCRGFWIYVVLMTSLNQNVLEVLQEKPPDIKTAFHRVPTRLYTRFLLLLSSIWLPSVGCYMVGILSLNMLPGSVWGNLFYLAALLGSVMLFITAIIAAVYMSLGFQTFAFQQQSPLPAFNPIQRSIRLVSGNFWRVTGFMIMLGLVTGVAVPMGVMAVLDISRVTPWLMQPVKYMVIQCLGYLAPEAFLPAARLGGWWVDLYHLFYQELIIHTETLSYEMTRSMIESGVILLMLPLGTFSYTQLYLDLISRKPSV